MTRNIAARVPESVAKAIDYVASEENTDKSKVIRELLADSVRERLIELSLGKYSKKQVSLGRAAELAKLPLSDFMRIAAERKVPMHYSLDSLERDFKAAAKEK